MESSWRSCCQLSHSRPDSCRGREWGTLVCVRYQLTLRASLYFFMRMWLAASARGHRYYKQYMSDTRPRYHYPLVLPPSAPLCSHTALPLSCVLRTLTSLSDMMFSLCARVHVAPCSALVLVLFKAALFTLFSCRGYAFVQSPVCSSVAAGYVPESGSNTRTREYW